jgi:hypothetical protein
MHVRAVYVVINVMDLLNSVVLEIVVQTIKRAVMVSAVPQIGNVLMAYVDVVIVFTNGVEVL